MSTLHIETVEDPDTGMVRAELRSAADGSVLIQSAPMYDTHEVAEAEIIEALKRTWPTSNPFDENPTIGV